MNLSMNRTARRTTRSWLFAGLLCALSGREAQANSYDIVSLASWSTTVTGTLYDSEGNVARSATWVASSFYLQPVGWDAGMWTYCLDLGGQLVVPSRVAFDQVPFSLATGEPPGWSTGGMLNAAYVYAMNDTGATTLNQRAGLQVAVWKALYDSTGAQQVNTDWSDGRLRISTWSDNNIRTYAEEYLGDVSTAVAITGAVLSPNPDGWPGPPSQSVIDPLSVFVPPGYESLLPDPASTGALLGLALSALAGARVGLARRGERRKFGPYAGK
jgi:hypothetical protein